MDKALDYLGGAISAGVEVLVALDNIDRLPPTGKVSVAGVAHAIASLSEKRVGLIVACRTEYLGLMQPPLDPGKTWPVPAMPLPDSATWDLCEIVKRRLALLGDPNLKDRLTDFYEDDGSKTEFQEELARAKAQVETTITQIWRTGEPRGSHDSGELARSLVYWHNGNIRDASQGIVALSETPQDPRHLESDPGILARRTRNRLYRHLIIDTHNQGHPPGTLYEFARLFGAESEFTSGDYLPFYYLRFRLLSHLDHKSGTRSLNALYRTFQTYGIQKRRVSEVIDMLAGRGPLDSGFVRIETDRGPIDRVADRERGSKHIAIELLPAGKYLVTELIVRCEFLYWSAVNVPECLEQLCDMTNKSAELLRGDHPTEFDKVLGSTIFMREYLLPRFRDEHPYMWPKSGWEDKDVARVNGFRRDFGYDRNNWFVLRVRNSVMAYANQVGVRPNAYMESAWDLLLGCSNQLNRVLKNERADGPGAGST